MAAEDKAEKLQEWTDGFHALSKRLNAILEDRPVIDWEKKLEKYLQLTLKQGDRQSTVSTLRAYLAPWVDWIRLRGSRPTDQLLKQYLSKENAFVRTSYYKIGRAIVDFTNHYVQRFDKVELIKPRGPQKERATLAMPRKMVEALKNTS